MRSGAPSGKKAGRGRTTLVCAHISRLVDFVTERTHRTHFCVPRAVIQYSTANKHSHRERCYVPGTFCVPYECESGEHVRSGKTVILPPLLTSLISCGEREPEARGEGGQAGLTLRRRRGLGMASKAPAREGRPVANSGAYCPQRVEKAEHALEPAECPRSG